jgi:hypothetical protein
MDRGRRQSWIRRLYWTRRMGGAPLPLRSSGPSPPRRVRFQRSQGDGDNGAVASSSGPASELQRHASMFTSQCQLALICFFQHLPYAGNCPREPNRECCGECPDADGRKNGVNLRTADVPRPAAETCCWATAEGCNCDSRTGIAPCCASAIVRPPLCVRPVRSVLASG